MRRLRFYQLSLRGLLLVTALIAGGLWVALWWVGRITPERGQTLVTVREQQVLQSMQTTLGLNYLTYPQRNIFL